MRPQPLVEDAAPYRVPRHPAPIDLDLAGNLGPAVPAEALAGCAAVRAYPDAGPLEADLATRLGLDAAQVVVTAGADDAIERICRAWLCPGRTAAVTAPGFVVTEQRARMTGAAVVQLPWPGGDFPVAEAIAAAPDLLVVTSPNNPTGAVVTEAQLRALSAALPETLLLVDLAYTEYADADLTPAALSLPNVVVARTLSKAWGLAALRVGYAAGPAAVIDALRTAGLPYAVSGLSVAMARRWLARGGEAVAAHVAQVAGQRAEIAALLAELGADVVAGQANFVFARHPRQDWLADGLAGLGIGVRRIAGGLRIGCPGTAAGLARLREGAEATLAPEALLLDIDGVLADVRGSYRAAIRLTAADLGVVLSEADIAAAKAAGQANNDWVLTRDLLADAGVVISLEAVTEAFEARMEAGLWRQERALVSIADLTALGLPLAAVTGRPRRDALRFLENAGLLPAFSAVVCMEDAPAKPDPAPVRLALSRLGVQRAWMVGDTPDDIAAARGAGVVPIGVVAPGEDAADALLSAGAARVLSGVPALSEVLR